MTETASKEVVLQAKLDTAMGAINLLSQQYHQLAKFQSGRHSQDHFTTCSESTCTEIVRTIRKIEAIGEMPALRK